MSTEIIYAIDDLPIQQNRTYASREEALACPRGDLALIQDSVSGIVKNASFRPDLIVYDECYQNEQAISDVFRQHLAHVAEVIGRYCGESSILEVGCGKGTFLELLRDRGFDAVGLDPAYEGDAPYIVKRPFSAALGIKGDVIILRHVLEHIPDPFEFLAEIREANGGEGIVYIESPCLDWIRNNRAWFDIYYEHVNYFRLSDFSRFFGRVLESGRLFNGQYLYVVADLSTLSTASRWEVPDFRLPDNFLAGVDRAIATIREGGNRKSVIWGASSKGVIFALHMRRRDNIDMDAAIDINPAKQGTYLPVTGLPVCSPAEGLARLSPGDMVFVMNSNYFAEIQSTAGNHYNYYKVDQNDI